MITKLASQQRDFNTQLSSLLSWESVSNKDVANTVEEIINTIRSKGDKALIDYSIKFDGVKAKSMADLMISQEELEKSFNGLSDKQKNAITIAAERIKAFHLKQNQQTWSYTEKDGTLLGQKITPLDCVGLYVPGGKAAYPSSVLMNAIPAKVAGVDELIMMVPTLNGKTNKLVLAAAYISGVDMVITVGGAQAIAALAYGTESVPKVDKIVGPGNIYVATAKRVVFGQVGIDMIAGPSEITVVGDKFSNPDWIASDLIAQAEHDELSQSILISKDKNLINKVQKSVSNQIIRLPRKLIAKKSLKSNGILIYVSSDQKLIEVINKIAPEHLELNIKKYKNIINKIINAGSIFIGKYSTEAVGDYLAGTNHVLPTSGSAKFSSGLSVYDFYKRISYINLSKKGIETLGPSVITLANFEGLAGHAKSVELRIRRK